VHQQHLNHDILIGHKKEKRRGSRCGTKSTLLAVLVI